MCVCGLSWATLCGTAWVQGPSLPPSIWMAFLFTIFTAPVLVCAPMPWHLGSI
jgi:hypothetical protein